MTGCPPVPPPVPGLMRRGVRPSGRRRIAFVVACLAVVASFLVGTAWKHGRVLSDYDAQWQRIEPNMRFDPKKPDRWRLVAVPDRYETDTTTGQQRKVNCVWEAQYRVGNEGRFWFVSPQGIPREDEK